VGIALFLDNQGGTITLTTTSRGENIDGRRFMNILYGWGQVQFRGEREQKLFRESTEGGKESHGYFGDKLQSECTGGDAKGNGTMLLPLLTNWARGLSLRTNFDNKKTPGVGYKREVAEKNKIRVQRREMLPCNSEES